MVVSHYMDSFSESRIMSSIVINYIGKFGSALTQYLPSYAKELYMWNMGISSIDLAPIAGHNDLQKIILSDNNLTEVDLTPLNDCTSLKKISLSHNKLKMVILCAPPNLESIHLNSNDIEEIDISPLLFCPKLKKVELGFTVLIGDSRLRLMLSNSKAIKNLEVSAGRSIRWKDNILSPTLLSRLEQSKKHEDKPKPISVATISQPPIIRKELVSSTTPEKLLDVVILRGGEIVGGKFEYKIKINNETSFVINNVTVTIVAYPQDCMKISGSSTKTISRIEPSGFRSPQFMFAPTKDCVEGQLLSTVSYIDHENNLQMKSVEPYTIRSVCDLLKPLEKTPEVFEKLIIDMDSTSEKMSLDWNPEVIFTKAQKLLPIKNFHIIDSDEKTIGGHFTGTIRGFAEGKYTGKKVAVQALISGPIEGNQAEVVVEGMGDDIAMVPTTVEEISVGIGSWICMNCGAAIAVEGVTSIKQKIPISCQYCRQTLTIDLYRK